MFLALQLAARSYLHMQSYTSPWKSFSAMNEFLIMASFSTSHLQKRSVMRQLWRCQDCVAIGTDREVSWCKSFIVS